VNNWGNNIDSLEGGVLRHTTFSKETSTAKTSVDGTNGKGGGWMAYVHPLWMDAIWVLWATTVDGWDMKYGRGE
jgi:hypothetical protein